MIDESIRGRRSAMRSIAIFVAALAASCGGSQAGSAVDTPLSPVETVVRQPLLVEGPKQPDYPLELRMQGVEGKVSASCTVNTEGRLADCHILQSTPKLDGVVLEALSKRRYRPAARGHEPVPIEKTFSFEFSLPWSEIELSPTRPLQPIPPDDNASTRPVLPFGAGMNRPKQIGGPPQPPFTLEALQEGMQGTFMARCSITKEGKVNRCRIIQAVPHLTNVALNALLERRYTPVLYQGTAVDVDYTFPFRFVIPDRAYHENATRSPAPTEVCAQGRVMVRCTVEDEGAVGSCQLLESSLDETTDQEILDAISTHRFRPEPPEGAPAGAEVTLKIVYRRRCAPPGP